MQANWAEENLQVIRTIMERSAVYRRALGPIMLSAGALGVLGAILGSTLDVDTSRRFVFFWFGVGVVAVCLAFTLARRQALKDKEAFWSGPTRRVAQAMLPALFVGLLLGVMALRESQAHLNADPVLPLMWACLYGCAIHAAGAFMPKGVKWLGWVFLIGAAASLIYVLPRQMYLSGYFPHLVMGVFFGGMQFAYGLVLLVSDKKQNVA